MLQSFEGSNTHTDLPLETSSPYRDMTNKARLESNRDGPDTLDSEAKRITEELEAAKAEIKRLEDEAVIA